MTKTTTNHYTAILNISILLLFYICTGPLLAQSTQRTGSTLLNFTQNLTPCTSEEELQIARYLKRRTESSLKLAEEIDLEELAELAKEAEDEAEDADIQDSEVKDISAKNSEVEDGDSEEIDIDEELAEELDLRISNLKASQKEIVEALKMVERSIEEFPAEYAHTGPILWLTVIKDIATEQKNAKELKEFEYVESNWPEMAKVAFNWSKMAELVLPNLFTRILEPKISALLRVIRQEDLVPPTR